MSWRQHILCPRVLKTCIHAKNSSRNSIGTSPMCLDKLMYLVHQPLEITDLFVPSTNCLKNNRNNLGNIYPLKYQRTGESVKE